MSPRFDPLHRFDTDMSPGRASLAGLLVFALCAAIFAALAIVHYDPSGRAWGFVIIVGLFGLGLAIVAGIAALRELLSDRRLARSEAVRPDPDERP